MPRFCIKHNAELTIIVNFEQREIGEDHFKFETRVEFVGGFVNKFNTLDFYLHKYLAPFHIEADKLQDKMLVTQAATYQCVAEEYSLILLMALIRALILFSGISPHKFNFDPYSPDVEKDDYNDLINVILIAAKKITYPTQIFQDRFECFLQSITAEQNSLVKRFSRSMESIKKYTNDPLNPLTNSIIQLENQLLALQQRSYVLTSYFAIAFGKIMQNIYDLTVLVYPEKNQADNCEQFIRNVKPRTIFQESSLFALSCEHPPAKFFYALAKKYHANFDYLKLAVCLDDGRDFISTCRTLDYSIATIARQSLYFFYLLINDEKLKQLFEFFIIDDFLVATTQKKVSEPLLIKTLKLVAGLPPQPGGNLECFAINLSQQATPDVALAVLELRNLWPATGLCSGVFLPIANIAFSAAIRNIAMMDTVTDGLKTFLKALDYIERNKNVAKTKPENFSKWGENRNLLYLAIKNKAEQNVRFKILLAEINFGNLCTFFCKDESTAKNIIVELCKEYNEDAKRILLEMHDSSSCDKQFLQLGRYFLGETEKRDITLALHYFGLISSSHPLYQAARFESANIHMCLLGDKKAALEDFNRARSSLPVILTNVVRNTKEQVVFLDNDLDMLITACEINNPAQATFGEMYNRINLRIEIEAKAQKNDAKKVYYVRDPAKPTLTGESITLLDTDGNNILQRAILARDWVLMKDVSRNNSTEELFQRNNKGLTAVDLLIEEGLFAEDELMQSFIAARKNLNCQFTATQQDKFFNSTRQSLVAKLDVLDKLIAYAYLAGTLSILRDDRATIFADPMLKRFAKRLQLENENGFWEQQSYQFKLT